MRAPGCSARPDARPNAGCDSGTAMDSSGITILGRVLVDPAEEGIEMGLKHLEAARSRHPIGIGDEIDLPTVNHEPPEILAIVDDHPATHR